MAVTQPAASTAFSYTGASDSRAVTLDSSCNFVIVKMASRINPGAWAATYGGNSLTALTSTLNSGSVVYGEFFYMASPPTGSNTLATTCPNSHPMVVEVMGFAGVNTGTPFHSQSGTNWATSSGNTGTTPSITLTSASGEFCVDMVTHEDAVDVALTVSGGSGASTMTTIRQGDGTNFERVGGSSANGSGSVTLSWSIAGSKTFLQIGVSLQAAAAATLHNLPLLGVG